MTIEYYPASRFSIDVIVLLTGKHAIRLYHFVKSSEFDEPKSLFMDNKADFDFCIRDVVSVFLSSTATGTGKGTGKGTLVQGVRVHVDSLCVPLCTHNNLSDYIELGRGERKGKGVDGDGKREDALSHWPIVKLLGLYFFSCCIFLLLFNLHGAHRALYINQATSIPNVQHSKIDADAFRDLAFCIPCI